jgi:tetratricopeptide (TPR) repeat protein
MIHLVKHYFKEGRVCGRSSYAKKQIGPLPCIALVLACLGLAGCMPTTDAKAEESEHVPLTQIQEDLLQQAFEIASAIPVEPHIKSRSTAQKKVVDVVIQLGHPDKAESFAVNIENWNRGAAHADLAFYYAERKAVSKAVDQLKMAEKVIENIDTWHRDRVWSRMAQTLELIGDTQAVSRAIEGIEGHEAAKIQVTRSANVSTEHYQQQIEALQLLFSDNKFDLEMQGLQGLSALYGSVYEDPARRSEVESIIRMRVEEVAPVVKIDLYLDLVSVAVSHGDQSTAMKWVDESRELFENSSWRPRFGIPVAARIAKSAFLAGDAALAEKMANEAEATYREQEIEIINIYKADTLVPLAEAFAVFGKIDYALVLYSRAVEASVENPNSRPRAEALSLIGSSMALYKVEPTEALWGRMLDIQANLGDPW